MQLSGKCQNLYPSMTLEIMTEAKKMSQQGLDVIDLSVGEPDLPTPDHIKKAAIDAIQENFSGYTPAAGIPELRKAVSEKFARENNLHYKVEEIVISCGAKYAIFSTLQILIDPGDDVLILSPYWVSYPQQVQLAGGRPIICDCKPERNFRASQKELENSLTKKTRLLILNSPCNPTGAVYNRKELEAIAELALKHGFWILSDEVYDQILFDEAQHISIASLSEEIKQKTITVNAVSKTFCMTGWRIGYAAAHKQIIDHIIRFQGHSISNPTSISQKAALKALQGGNECVKEMQQIFKKRRELVLNLAAEIPLIKTFTPSGAFYLWMDASSAIGAKTNDETLPLIQGSSDLAKYLLRQAYVAVVPGSAFGSESFLRVSFANSSENLKKGLNRIKSAMQKLESQS